MLRKTFAVVLAAWFMGPAASLVGAQEVAVKLNSTADHTKFKELQQTFKSGPEVTKACLSCHTEAARQVHRTKHWTWEFMNPENKQKLGKKNVLNNFCISVESNYAGCTACHVGYGWKDANFDFTKEETVDCLVCHDTTGLYQKPPGLAGNPVVGAPLELPPGSGKFIKPVDLTKVAQKVGKTSRDTCGACHFRGGGGDGVKHGDMDTSLAAPDAEVDIHMDAAGLDFSCGTCHKASSHDVPGSRYTPTAQDKGGAHIRGKEKQGNPATCVACHSNAPHKEADTKQAARLNHHANKVACQTCHIPSFARGGVPTKMSWDWSTAGKLDKDGKQFTIKDDHGHAIYASHKGDFVLGQNVKPQYRWFNGEVTYTLMGDKIEKVEGGPVGINRINGSPGDGKSMIWPFKIMHGKQPYDPEYKNLVKPHTAGNDDTGYWKNLNWEKAIAAGMKDTGLPFSGKVDFIETEMYWPITHMVAPKDKALGCVECHTKGGRLEGIEGVYLPGRDANPFIDKAGWTLALLTLLGVLGHGVLRIFTARKH
ncbi:MAG: tetrathionate reductase family octaheme c-type cytochrome [Rhodocyclaceae bacterium]|jgi:octaheme c-type cytochrome (tetrathionate reductase family)|nr:tetrathionate reductase family octaheme c-type cytochrome [Rhodocyclaceae bacterium]